MKMYPLVTVLIYSKLYISVWVSFDFFKVEQLEGFGHHDYRFFSITDNIQ